MSTQTPEQIADETLDAFNQYPDRTTRALMIEAIKADRAQRDIPDGTTVFIVQDEMGDVIDVTTNREWAEWETRTADDNPIRSLIKETVWDGPTPEEWRDYA